MIVSVARDGELVGEFEAESLRARARRGEVQPTDYYWREGMENWEYLGDYLGEETWRPPPRPAAPIPVIPRALPAALAEEDSASDTPPSRVPRVVIAVLLALIFLAIVLNLIRRPEPAPVTSAPAPTDVIRTNMSARDRAVSDLMHNVERLPTAAKPPGFIYYSGLDAKTSAAPEPLVAVIRGSENVVNPLTRDLTVRADFTVRAEYHDGQWLFRQYEEMRNDLVQQTSTPLTRDDTDAIPPAIVSLLGLQSSSE